jgi:hypothetical protein
VRSTGACGSGPCCRVSASQRMKLWRVRPPVTSRSMTHTRVVKEADRCGDVMLGCEYQMAGLGRRLVDERPAGVGTSRRELGRRSRKQRVGPAGWVVISGALVLGAVLLLVGHSAAAVTCAVTAGVLWLLLHIPDVPENGSVVPSTASVEWSPTGRRSIRVMPARSRRKSRARRYGSPGRTTASRPGSPGESAPAVGPRAWRWPRATAGPI